MACAPLSERQIFCFLPATTEPTEGVAFEKGKRGFDSNGKSSREMRLSNPRTKRAIARARGELSLPTSRSQVQPRRLCQPRFCEVSKCGR
jgi:hypothetical protein